MVSTNGIDASRQSSSRMSIKELPKWQRKNAIAITRHSEVDQFDVKDGGSMLQWTRQKRPSSLYLIFIDTHLHGIYSDTFARRKIFPIRTYTFSYYFQKIERSLCYVDISVNFNSIFSCTIFLNFIIYVISNKILILIRYQNHIRSNNIAKSQQILTSQRFIYN